MGVTVTRKNLLTGLAAAGVLGVGIAVPTLAFADNGGGPSATPAASTSAAPPAAPGKAGREGRQAAFAAELAQELGVPQDKVEAALAKIRAEHKPAGRPERPDPAKLKADRQAALKERLAQAVKDGKLTQEQADAITKAIDAGVLPLGGFGGPGRGGWDHRGPAAGGR
ncbi:hypothetical protein ACFFWC_11455 [Plantactinospora siamensis]|uniref:LTXXQ motif family protein n=1 Tax=Plantactinospora siamensis TaxID=555372 RepID=A0ABV6P001_9ACTN